MCIYFLCDKHASVPIDYKRPEAKKLENPYDNGLEIELLIEGENKKTKITNHTLQTFYEVDFGDGTYSSDMLAEDIESFSERELNNNLPEEGSTVKVKWTDGQTYNCIFLGSNKTYVYTVRLNLSLILEVFP